MIIDSFKFFSYYGSNPVALKDMHIHMYFFCVRRCRRPVAAADVNFFVPIQKLINDFCNIGFSGDAPYGSSSDFGGDVPDFLATNIFSAII